MSDFLSTIGKRGVRKYHHLIDGRSLKNNRAWKNKFSGKKAFIIGNGPSIKNQDVTKLANEWTFAMNAFYLHEKYDVIHPKFYVIFHSEYLSGNEVSMNFLRGLEAKVHEDTVFILPLKAKRMFEEKNLFSKNKKIYIYVRGFLSKKKQDGIDITKTVPTPMSVSVMCLIVAIYLGFDPIYLMGLEHNWLATKPNSDFQHFTDGHDKQFLTRNFQESYEENCRLSHLLFRNYRLIRDSSPKTQVYNLTPESYLDVFPFKKFEEVVI